MRAEVAHLKARLEDLDAFEAEWRAYADKLMELAVEMTGREPGDIPATLRPMLNRVEEMRVRIVSLGYTKFDPTYFNRTEFAPLTRVNLRTHPRDLFDGITEPTSSPRSVHLVTLNPLEARLGEAHGLIARMREQMKDDLRAKALRVAEHERGTVTLRALFARIPGAGVGRFLSSALLEHTKGVVGTLFFVAMAAGVHYCAPGVEQKAKAWWGRATADSSRVQP